MVTRATYISIWDGGVEVPSPCDYDVDAKRCFNIEDSGCGEGLDNLDDEVVELADGTRLGADDGVTFDY